jgi:hypothetical protein
MELQIVFYIEGFTALGTWIRLIVVMISEMLLVWRPLLKNFFTLLTFVWTLKKRSQ